MTKYVVLGADGQKHVFDLAPGLTPDQVEQQANALLQQHAASIPATNAVSTSVQPKPGPVGFPMSVAGRALHGAVWDFGGPVDETLVRAGRVVGVNGDLPVEAVQQARQDAENTYQQQRAQAGLSGMDIARGVGAMVPQVALTRLAAGALPEDAAAKILRPQNYRQTALSGGAQGAVAGATSNVSGPDEMSDKQYFEHLLAQTVGGGVLGAGVAPAARFVTNTVLGAANPAYRWVKNWIGSKMSSATPAQTISNNAGLFQNYMENQAAAAGVAWNTLPAQVRQSLMSQARDAMVQTGETPDRALANRFFALRQGLPDLTTGQATRDPGQFSREMNNPSDAIRSRLNQQQQAAAQRATDLINNAPGTAKSPYQLGASVRADRQSVAKSFDDQVQNLYDQAKSDANGYQIITNTADMAQNATTELKRNLVWSKLDPDDRNMLDQMAQGNVSIRNTVANIQAINAKLRADPGNKALNIIKKHLDGLIYGSQDASQVVGADPLEVPTVAAQFHPGQDASSAQDLFNQAREARARLGSWTRQSSMNADLTAPAYKAQVPNEDVFNKYVLHGSVDDLAGAWHDLDPATQDDIRRQFLKHVLQKASQRAGDIESADDTESVKALTGYGNALKFINDFPQEKLNMLLPGDSLQDVKDLLNYVRLTKEAPPGDFVDRTGSAPAIANWLSNTHYIPWAGHYIGPLGRIAGSAVRSIDRIGADADALGGNLVAPGSATPGADDAAAPLTTRLLPSVAAPIANALGGQLPVGASPNQQQANPPGP